MFTGEQEIVISPNHSTGVSGQDVETDRQRQNAGQAKSWRQRHPVMLATMIGAAAGAAGGCALGSNAQNPDVSCSFYTAPFAFLGAGVGFAVGLVTDRNSEATLHSQDMQRRIKNGQHVVAVSDGRRKTLGKIVDVSGDSIMIASRDGTRRTIAARALTGRVTSDSLKNGMLIGTAVGALIAVAGYTNDSGAGAITAIPAWALIGAGVDKAIRHEELLVDDQGAGLTPSVSVRPWLGRRSGGVALSVGF